jgi:Ca2+-binding EF-hand superfamily protein
MPPPFLLATLLLAAAAPAQVSPSTPIMVTAHPWAPFISPMGEAFRAHNGSEDTLANWFYQADRDRNGFLTAAEMQADADRFFGTLDTSHDGQIDPDELAHYEWEVAPEIQVMSKTRRKPSEPAPVVKADSNDDRPRDRQRDRRKRREDAYASLGIRGELQGAARYSLLNIPEPVAAADTDFDRAITHDEFRQAAVARFQLLDTAGQGRLSLVQLEAMPHAPSADRKRQKWDRDASDPRIGNPLPTGP